MAVVEEKKQATDKLLVVVGHNATDKVRLCAVKS
jgi:hypothetical protein